MAINLAGKPIVITGASSGIGASTALACAVAGMPVAIMARRADRLEAVATHIREVDFPGSAQAAPVLTHVGDVNSPDDCLALLDRAEAEFGPVYAAFANAGYGQVRPTWDMPIDEVRAMFETNLYGSLNLLRPALDRFAERGVGHALLCSSCLSKLSIPNYGCYSATKAAQDHFGRAMRIEMKPLGVAVSTVHPIGTRTEFFEIAAKGSPEPRPLPGERRLQPPKRVADAIVRRLRRNTGGEIWTSTPAQLAFGLANVFPRLTDLALTRRANRKA
ncbi:MAG: short-subunit dehydrogenase [Phycisphaerales bacterium]|jgi:short-subunit dehydrogenase